MFRLPTCSMGTSILSRWWIQIFFILALFWGDDPVWRVYFSKGLVRFNHQLVTTCILP